ncbi:sugar ABC transporter permease [bacterium]|nr:sugar ABC transporter permease [bacterium]
MFRHFRRTQYREGFIALVFIAPALVALFTMRILPAFNALQASFYHEGEYVGLDNYDFLINSEPLVNSIQTTLTFNLIINPLQILIALALAILLTENLPGAAIWRVAIFMPAAVPLAVSSIVWGIAFRPDDGMVNSLLALLAIEPQPWLTSADQALASIIILASWAGVGYWMIFLIAGLRDIPVVYREAAALDGAGYWGTLLYVVLPLMRRPLAFVLVANTVANFLLFPPIQILTRGGPEGSTNLFMHEIYRRAFRFADYGLASAGMVILISIMLVIVIIQFRLLRTRV